MSIIDDGRLIGDAIARADAMEPAVKHATDRKERNPEPPIMHPALRPQMPTIGRIVHVRVPEGDRTNGAEFAPAIITRVFEPREGKSYPYINVQAFLDFGGTKQYGSLEHKDDAAPGYYGATWAWPERS